MNIKLDNLCRMFGRMPVQLASVIIFLYSIYPNYKVIFVIIC